jgi:RNA polymerase sigma factor (sigma-70 family)
MNGEMMTDNEKDIEMLLSDPRGLISKYQETIRIIVRKYIASGLFKPAEFEDVVQEVNVSLLAKMPAMQAQYNGISLLRTYLSVIVRNICLKEHERLRRNSEVDLETIDEIVNHDRVEDRLALAREVRRFKTIVELYRKQRPKLLLCLKLRYRIPVTQEDLVGWFPQLHHADRSELLHRFGDNYDEVGDHDIYKVLTPIINRLEEKANSPDALRKWTDSKIQEILRLLNGSREQAKHTSETLRTLVDDFFSPFLIKK